MKMSVVYVVVFVLVFSSFFVLTSCGKKPYSLDNISVDYNRNMEFVLKSSKGISENQIEKDLALVEIFNKAMKECSYLRHMIEADMQDGLMDSGFVFDGADMFLRKMTDFANANYSKAKSMFPDIAPEQFYYHAAVAYSKANHDSELFETPYFEFQISNEIKTFIPTYDQLMATAFWVSYTSERFDIDYGNKNNLPIEKRFEIESLDSNSSFELAIIMHLALKETIANGHNIEVGKRFGPKNEGKIISQYLVNYQRDMLREDGGVKRVSLDEDNFFFQIGNISTILALNSQLAPSKEEYLLMGNLAIIASAYLNSFDHINNPGFLYSSLLSVFIAGERENYEDHGAVMHSEWNVTSWAYENEIKGWD